MRSCSWMRLQVKLWLMWAETCWQAPSRRPRSDRETKLCCSQRVTKPKWSNSGRVNYGWHIREEGEGVLLQPPFLPRTPEEEEADRKGEVAETGRPLQREVGDRWEVKAETRSTDKFGSTLNKRNKTYDSLDSKIIVWTKLQEINIFKKM